MKSLIELLILIALLWVASWYGSQNLLLPFGWWILAVILTILLITDLKKK